MIEKLKPYPAYKDFGVEWLGQVPAHWEVRRLGSVTQVLNGATPSSSMSEYWDGDIVWVTPDDLGKLKGRYIDDSSRRITDEGYNACGTTLAPAGSIVISIRAPIGHLGILRVAACANQGCRLLIPQSGTVNEYLYHVLVAARPSLEALGQGSTFLELSRSKLRSFPVPHPPLPEQTAIVRFLDYMDRRIRRYIRAKQRLIKLLEEYKQALIHQAVTGQIDVRTGEPYPAYKDSGVEWLGKVPAHWEVRAIRHITSPVKGKQPKALYSKDEAPAGAQPYLTMQYMRGHKGTAKALYSLSDGLVTARKGDVLLLWDGANAGEFFLAKDGVVPSTAALLATDKHDRHYLYFMLKQCEPWLRAFSTGMGIPHVDGSFLKQMQIALPPLPEQTAIVEYLDAQTAKIDAAMAAARREIELLREYRTRLIADVVTGKVDVREVAAQLPEEPPEEGEWMDTEEAVEGEAADDEAVAETFSEEEVAR
jgi:type I restriction enzyme S subunit